jgi:predicted nucleic acid-binding protein
VRFWESSAIIPLFVDQAGSGRVRDLAKQDGAMAVWWATWVECEGAWVRLRREGAIGPEVALKVREEFEGLRARWVEVQPSADLRDAAVLLLRRHPLRAADAMQLAAAAGWASGVAAHGGFVSLDERLRAAADREGFTVLPT